jgi:hypothetical protein
MLDLAPDGFGPGFYRKFWNIANINFFDGFFQQNLDTESINQAFLLPIPKSSIARTPNITPKLPNESNSQSPNE